MDPFQFFANSIRGHYGLTTHSLFSPFFAWTELENTAPRIKSDFKPKHEDLIEGQKQKQLRRERRIKRILTVIIGYAVMGWMIYLIAVTARTTPKLWDPYDILGVSRVRYSFGCWLHCHTQTFVLADAIFFFLERRWESYITTLQAPIIVTPPR